MMDVDVAVIGGGAAGFFAAINISERNPQLKIVILERGSEGLQKVKVSGGGRCNVTHAEFIPQDLVKNYPRGEKELLGPFHQFMTGDTIAWFENRGVALKIEDDGRMFPVSNSSQTIIDCFLNEVKKQNIEVFYNHSVKTIKKADDGWLLNTSQTDFLAQKLLVASGSSAKIWSILERINHTVIKPVPSLFTFDINDERIKDIPGVVVQNVEVEVVGSDLYSQGPLLITHVGMSAPAILKLSAYGALELAKRNYNFQIQINFINQNFNDCLETLKAYKLDFAKKAVYKSSSFDLPKRLWQKLVIAANINEHLKWAELNRNQLEWLAMQLTSAIFQVTGKSTFKEEFVTAGGVDLKEINFKTFESKIHKNLYFAGEVINVDAITGGFNFQNAWTSGFLAAKSIAQ